jgi:hypothetical protein
MPRTEQGAYLTEISMAGVIFAPGIVLSEPKEVNLCLFEDFNGSQSRRWRQV